MISSQNLAQASCRPPDVDQDKFETIFVRSYRHKSGKLMIAANYGLKAFAFRVRKKP